MAGLFKGFVSILVLMLVVACGGSGDSGSSRGAGPQAPVAPFSTGRTQGGCQINLISPAAGETLDFSKSAVREFKWSVDSSKCNEPLFILFAGSNGSLEAMKNVVKYQIPNSSEKENDVYTAYFSGADLEDLTSDTGILQWAVSDNGGKSLSASRWFTMKK